MAKGTLQMELHLWSLARKNILDSQVGPVQSPGSFKVEEGGRSGQREVMMEEEAGESQSVEGLGPPLLALEAEEEGYEPNNAGSS